MNPPPSLTQLIIGFEPPRQGPLATSFARADVKAIEGNGVLAMIATLAGTDELPAAMLTALGQGAGEGRWSRLDPVHLLADADSLRLVPGTALDISEDEADALAAHLRVHAGLDIRVVTPAAWLVAADAAQWSLDAPHEFAGRHIGEALPPGPALAPFRRWWNEVQMILHDAPVNRRRFDLGVPTINSVWPWGARGGLDDVRWPFSETEADDPLFEGLELFADRAAARRFRLGGGVEESVDMLHAGVIDELNVLDGMGLSYRLTRSQRWRFWRRPRRL